MALYIDARCSSASSDAIPYAGLTHENLADYLTAAEGVSHFVYVAWNTGHDKPVTLLELELQAEVDKYVLGAWLLRAQGAGRFPRELHRALFERAHVDPVAAAGRVGLYHTASSYAARFCRRVARLLERKRHGVGARGCWPSCGGSIGGETCASCATSNATPDEAQRRDGRHLFDVVVVLGLAGFELAFELDPLAELAQIAS